MSKQIIIGDQVYCIGMNGVTDIVIRDFLEVEILRDYAVKDGDVIYKMSESIIYHGIPFQVSTTIKTEQ